MSIVIVDDHPLFRSRARRMLQMSGLEVVGEAEDAAQGIAETRRLKPDVVLLDVQLPDCDGISVAEEIAAASGAPKVVLISSREATDYGSQLENSRAVGFIHKPALSRAAIEQIVGAPASGA